MHKALARIWGRAGSSVGSDTKEIVLVEKPSQFNKQSADQIINFNLTTDSIEIDIDSFAINGSANFAFGKNRKVVNNKLAKQDFDFLYDQKKGVSTSTKTELIRAWEKGASLRFWWSPRSDIAKY